MRAQPRILKSLLCALIVIGAAPSRSEGQSIDPARGMIEPQRSVYLRALDAPMDLGAMLEAAQSLEEAGNLEDAIRLYLRMLFVDAGLDPIRLKIALLEYRRGNFPAALAQLDRLSTGDLSVEQAAAAQRLREEAEKALSQNRIDGFVSAGLVYHSNADAAPDDTVFILGVPGVDPIGAGPDSAFGAFVELNLGHRYDLQRQDGLALVTEVTALGEKLFDETQFDFGFLAASFGPRFELDPGRPGTRTLRPFVEVEVLSFDREFYSVTPLVGVETGIEIEPDLDIVAEGRVGWQIHGDGADATFVRSDPVDVLPGEEVTLPFRQGEDRNGLVLSAAAAAIWTLDDRTVVSVGPLFGIKDAKDDAVSYLRAGIAAAVTRYVDFSPLVPGQPLTATLSTRFHRDAYREPDTQVTRDPGFGLGTFLDPFEKRRDRALFINLDAALPVTERVSAVAGVGWTRVFSNIDNFSYSDVTVSVGARLRF